MSRYIFDALDGFFFVFVLDLFFFRSILDGSQYLEKLIHTILCLREFWFLKFYHVKLISP